MKNVTLVAIVAMLVSGSVMADSNHSTPAAPTVVSVMNGAIDVGTFVSAAPGQWVSQTSVGSLSGSTSVTGTTAVPIITSSIVGYANSAVTGTGSVYPSFTVNYLGSSAVVQGSIATTVTNHPLPVTTIAPSNNNNNNNHNHN